MFCHMPPQSLVRSTVMFLHVYPTVAAVAEGDTKKAVPYGVPELRRIPVLCTYGIHMRPIILQK